MNAWGWVTAVLAIWGAVSIMAGVFWGLIGRRIFRPRPVQPQRGVDSFDVEPPKTATGPIVPVLAKRSADGGER